MAAETATPNANLAEAYGLNYVNVPVDKSALSATQIAAFEQAIAQTDGPYLFHCATGARAALILSLSRAERQGWSAERTLAEAAAMGFNLQSSDAFVEFVKTVRKT